MADVSDEMVQERKIVDLIKEYCDRGISIPFHSLEFFPPKTPEGMILLQERILRYKTVVPLFIDFTWGAGGSTSESTINLTILAKQKYKLEPNMHLTCTNMPVEKVDRALEICKSHHIRNIMALRGDPPAGIHTWKADEKGFQCALDLIQYIKKKYGDYFCISVAGYPEGHPDKIKVYDGDSVFLSDAEKIRCSVSPENGEISICSDKDYTEEIIYLKKKCDAGADIIITQMLFDPEIYGQFVKACRAANITAPIIPGIMCINSFTDFKRMTKFCKSRVPASLWNSLTAVKDIDSAVKEIGVDFGEEICRSLISLGAPGFHFYTLNREKVTRGILKRLGMIGEEVFSVRDGSNASFRSLSGCGTTDGGYIDVREGRLEALSFEDSIFDLTKKGRDAIYIALSDMPGLICCKNELLTHGDRPLQSAKISVSIRITAQNAVLIEILHSLGAEIRWCSSGVLATDDSVVCAVESNNCATVFARQGQSVEEYWSNAIECLLWPDDDGPNIVIDECGDLALLMHEGIEAEEEYARSGKHPSVKPEHGAELSLLVKLLSKVLRENPQQWQKTIRRIQGLSVSTTAGAHRLLRLEGSGLLRVAAMNTSDCVTRVLCRGKKGGGRGVRVQKTLVDNLKKLFGVNIQGKNVVVCGYGDIGRACTAAIADAGAKPLVTEIDPICAYRAAMGGYKVVTLEQALKAGVHIYLTTTGVRSTISAKEMILMKDKSIVASVSHLDGEIELSELAAVATRNDVNKFVSEYTFEDGRSILVSSEGRLLDMSDTPDVQEPGLTASTTLSMQAMVILELWRYRNSGRYTRGTVSSVPRLLDENVARIHLPVLNASLTQLSRKQSDYMRVPVEGPFKPYAYRYAGTA